MSTNTLRKVTPQSPAVEAGPESLKKSDTFKVIVKDKSAALKESICNFLDGKSASIFMAVLTVYALLGDDLRLGFFTKADDNAFYSISVLALWAFSTEVILNTYAKPGYALGFYFALDLVSTLSLIPDIAWIWDPLTGAGESDDASQAATLKAGRASRAGTKAGRIVRIVRLVRMVRIAKLFKLKSNKEDLETQDVSEPSTVGKILTELTTRRLIILVLTMIIVLPLIDGSLDEDYDEFQELGLSNLHRYRQDLNVSMDWIQTGVKDYLTYAGPILAFALQGVASNTTDAWIKTMKFQSLATDGDYLDTETDFTNVEHPITGWNSDVYTTKALVEETYRSSEFIKIESSGCYENQKCIDCDTVTTCMSYAYFDNVHGSQMSAATNVAKTFFIMFVLSIGVILFTRDAQSLVIGPIERMMGLVNKLAENPLASAKTQKNEYDDEEVPDDYETAMLEETLSKIGGLLQVGFGVAGTEIIAANMGGAGELNVMIPGKKITSIFGFGIIERFTEMCSVLEEDIITYINTIADIVHSDTNTYFGAANKNIGPAFLLAWKICDGPLPGLRDPRDINPTKMDLAERLRQRQHISALSLGDGTKLRHVSPQEIVDSALTAVLKMRVGLHQANHGERAKLHQFNTRPSVASAFGANYETHLGFGLHMGWAIEGAIGSRYKIDASYLSPNVNMAARLEAATGQFDIPLLISEWVVEELSPEAQKCCRKIDRVTVKGSQIPMELWTFDIGNYDVKVFEPTILEDGTQRPVKFGSDDIYKHLKEGIAPEFFPAFEIGVERYLAGEWNVAQEHLTQCLALKGDDGPTKLLLRILGQENNTAPASWPGFRELTEK